MQLVIDQPCCDWIALRSKDKRRGSVWLCRTCGHRGKGKRAPECSCKPIHVDQQNRNIDAKG